MKDKETGLTEKETLFIREYCQNGFNGTQAAIKAGYSKKTANAIAAENLLKPHIRNALREYVDSVIGKFKDTLEYEIIQTYKLLAFYNPDDIIDKEGRLKKQTLKAYGELAKCIKGLQTTYNAKGQKQVKVLLADRENALEMLSKYIGILRDTTINVNVYSDKIKQEIESVVDESIGI